MDNQEKSSLKLTSYEKGILVGEGFVTAGIIVLLYYATYQIFRILVNAFPAIFEDFWFFGDLFIEMKDQSLLEVNPLFMFFIVVGCDCYCLEVTQAVSKL